jgi:type II secretory pathway predicted ATPase ExeA
MTDFGGPVGERPFASARSRGPGGGPAGGAFGSLQAKGRAGRTAKEIMGSALDIYTDHFGLTERPFSLVPDPEFLFWSAAHRRAYTMLEYGILTRAPITLITGEVGAGKTTLVHHLLRNMEEGVKIGLISNAHGSRGELLRWVLMALGQPAPQEATYVDLFASFQAYLIEEYAGGNRVILIFDEAQNLSRESLEELRMFTNINSNKDELLQLVLVGQPELRDIVRRPDMRQFAQRVSANFHLTPMDAPTVRAYIAHRLRVAGVEQNLFSQAACHLVFEATGGVPRLVNQLCDLAMVYAFTKNQRGVIRFTVQQVLDDGAFFGAALIERKDDAAQ